MNTIIYNLIKNFLSVIVICLTSITSFNLNQENIQIYNQDNIKSTNINNKIIKYDVIKKYNFKLPYGEEKIITEGQNGIQVLDSNNNYITLQEKIDKVVEIGLGKNGSYNGILTSYGPDCASCDGRGYVSCPKKDGTWFSLINDGIYYNDSEYGDVRVVAADQREFPCGTVLEISNSYLNEPIYGIVLDTGYSMKKAYNNGIIHIALAFKSEKEININTNNDTNFNVKRWGW